MTKNQMTKKRFRGPGPLKMAQNGQKQRVKLHKTPINDDFSPEVLVLDPWNGITGDDSQRNYRAALDNIREAVPKGDKEPAILIVAHNRKPKTMNAKLAEAC